MFKVNRKSWILLLFILSLLVISGCGGKPKTTYKVKVIAQVMDAESGKSITTASTKLSSGVTGNTSNGITEFTLEGDKDYTFISNAPGYIETIHKAHIGKQNITITIKLSKKTYTLTGKIVDGENKPVNQANVKVIELDRNVESGGDGRFTFDKIPVSNIPYTLEVTKPGYGTRKLGNIQVNEEVKDIGTVILSNTPGTLSGIVKNTNDQALNGVTVRIVELGITSQTNFSGEYSFSVLPGTYTVEFTHSNYSKVTQSNVKVESNKTTSLAVRLDPKPGSLSGVVIDNYDVPVGGVIITIMGTNYKTDTLSNGFFSFTEIPPGNYRIEFSHPQFKFGNAQVIIESGKETLIGNYRIEEKTGTLTGRVIDRTELIPLLGATVRIIERGITSTTNGQGYFTFNNLRIGTYTLEVTATDYSKEIVNEVVVKENSVINVPDISIIKNPGSIAGTVKDSQTQQNLKNVKVTLIENTAIQTTTNAIGAFKIENMEPGIYSLKFDLPNYNVKEVTDIYVEPRKTVNIGAVQLVPKACTVLGTTTPGARVELRGTSHYATANGAGAFVVNDIMPGNYTLDISKTDYNPLYKTITLKPGETLDLGSIPLNAIPGRIIGITNAESVRVIETEKTYSVANELFEITNVMPGNYTLEFSKENYQTRNISVSVSANKTTDTGKVVLIPFNGSISGYITSSGGNITLVEKKDTQFYNNPAYFKYDNLEPGIYHLTLKTPDCTSKFYEVEVKPGEETNLGSISSGSLFSWVNNQYDKGEYTISSIDVSKIKFRQTVVMVFYLTANSNYNSSVTIYANGVEIANVEGRGERSASVTINPGDEITWHCNPSAPGASASFKSMTYYTDQGQPSIDIINTWGYSSSLSATINVADVYTGISSLQYSFSNSPSSPGSYKSISNGGTVTISTPGVWYLHVKTTDGVGNVSTMVEGPYIVY